MSEKITVAVIDDDDSIRRSLQRLLTSTAHEVHVFASAGEFLASPQCETALCVVSDLRMPGLDGLQLQEVLREKLPHLSVVMITGHGDVPAIVTAMKGGAADFLEKPFKGSVLIGAIRQAAERTRRLEAVNTEIGELKACHKQLTPREREVFALVAAGLLNKQIAAELGAAEKTIKQHRGRVMQKMQAESIADLVLMAERLGARPVDSDFSKARGLVTSVARKPLPNHGVPIVLDVPQRLSIPQGRR